MKMRLTLLQQHLFFWKFKSLFVKIKSVIDLLFFIKQTSQWTRFFKLRRSQKLSRLYFIHFLFYSKTHSKIDVMITSLIEMLELPNFGHITTHKI